MTATYIRTLYRYHDWANHRMLSAVGELSVEQRRRDLQSSFPSVQATLVHMLASEWMWLERWRGTSPVDMSGVGDLSDLGDLSRRWESLAAERSIFVNGQSDEDVRHVVTYQNTRGDRYEQPLWELMCHAANHATYHRGQITTMIRQVGGTPIPTDMIAYFRSDEYGG